MIGKQTKGTSFGGCVCYVLKEEKSKLMKAVGVPCTVQEPFEMKVVTEAQLEAKYGKGKLKAVWSDIK